MTHDELLSLLAHGFEKHRHDREGKGRKIKKLIMLSLSLERVEQSPSHVVVIVSSSDF